MTDDTDQYRIVIAIDGIAESYNNYINYKSSNEQKQQLIGLLFGYILTDERVVHVKQCFFTCIDSSFEATIDTLSFAMTADICLLGVLYIDVINECLELDDSGLILQTNVNAIQSRNINNITAQMKHIDATIVDVNTIVEEVNRLTCIIVMTLTINIDAASLKAIDKSIDIELNTAIEMIKRQCFISSDRSLIIAADNDNQTYSMLSLFSLAKGDNRKYRFDKDKVTFYAFENISANVTNDRPRLVPVIRTKQCDGKYYKLTLQLSGVATVTDAECNKLHQLFVISLIRQMYSAVDCFRRYAKWSIFDETAIPQSCIFIPNGWSNILCIHYPKTKDQQVLLTFRDRYHRLFNLSYDRPMIRLSMQHIFEHDRRLLRNVHQHIRYHDAIGNIATVQGHYNYHHYMQDGIDDNGWGCAYRSLQTICSWYRLQGYTDKPVPSHAQIQQALVDIGDREAHFVGSRQWIGSLELSYCLSQLFNVESRIINTTSGDEVAENARQIMKHFETNGTPIMIGGGQLAHTIIGIDFNSNTGACEFLVLDPHYTGVDDIKTIISNGWCGWKSASFWKTSSFYNLLLPIRPINVM